MDVHTVQVTRMITAPAERVYGLWTEPAKLCRWWGPHATADVDLRVGGAWRLGMDYPGAGPMFAGGVYQAIGPVRLAFTFAWEGEGGAGSDVTVDLIPRGTLTELVLTHEGLPTEADAANHRQGWSDCLDRLVAVAQAD
jgi:uncharacterized protein YndB with AHSA1/START domain